MKDYIYRGDRGRSAGPAEVVPSGDYDFILTDCSSPHEGKSNPDNTVIDIEIEIKPSGVKVLAHPWCGVTRDGEERDHIGDFLHAINRVPKIGERPRWNQLVGARGRCRLKIEPDLNGIDRNVVHFFHRPKEVGPTTENPRSFTKEEVEASRKATVKAAERDPDLDVEPDDIPF
jgi:hypothetical protein